MKPHFAFMLAGSSLMGIAPLGLAQTNDSSTASVGSPDNSVEEIIVTARRRAESLQDVPQTVNAVTNEAIEKLNLLEFEDIQTIVPGLNLEGGLNSGASMRGVSFETFTLTFVGDQEVNSFSLATTFGPSGYRSFGRIAEREIGLSLRYSFGSR